jgi:ribosomal protein S18 acetylase RimI-like enzyme
MTGVTVREALESELDAAGELVARAYGGIAVPDGHVADYAGYLGHVRNARGRSRDCPILVAVDEAGALLGCVSYVPDAANPFAELEVDGEAGFRMLGVDPAAQGRGAGRALVEACIARAGADGRRGIAISTAPEMAAAHRLYERLGFRRAPERDFEPVPGIGLWAYVLAL